MEPTDSHCRRIILKFGLVDYLVVLLDWQTQNSCHSAQFGCPLAQCHPLSWTGTPALINTIALIGDFKLIILGHRNV